MSRASNRTTARGLAVLAASRGFEQSLVEELGSANHGRRVTACLELGDLLQSGREEAIEVLIQALADSHPAVRSAAAQALSGGPPARVEEALLETLAALTEENTPGHRASLVLALGLLDRPAQGELARTLLAQTAHPDQDVRFQAVAALNRLGCDDEAFREAISRLVGDPDDEVAAVAATAGAEFALDELREPILERWRQARGFAKRHLALAAAHLGSDEVVDSLARGMRDGFEALAAVNALVRLESEAAGTCLHKAARSWRVHPIVRSRAAVALLEVGHPEGPALVDKHLAHRRNDVRWSTLEWLGGAQLHGYRDLLIARLRDRDSLDSGAAARGLALLGGAEVLEVLRQTASQDPRHEVREEVAQAVELLEAWDAEEADR